MEKVLNSYLLKQHCVYEKDGKKSEYDKYYVNINGINIACTLDKKSYDVLVQVGRVQYEEVEE